MNKVEYFVELGIHRTDRLRFRFKKDKGKIVDLVVQFEILAEDKWEWYREQFLKKIKK